VLRRANDGALQNELTFARGPEQGGRLVSILILTLPPDPSLPNTYRPQALTEPSLTLGLLTPGGDAGNMSVARP
jgi:hypothetical protein